MQKRLLGAAIGFVACAPSLPTQKTVSGETEYPVVMINRVGVFPLVKEVHGGLEQRSNRADVLKEMDVVHSRISGLMDQVSDGEFFSCWSLEPVPDCDSGVADLFFARLEKNSKAAECVEDFGDGTEREISAYICVSHLKKEDPETYFEILAHSNKCTTYVANCLEQRVVSRL